MAKLQPVSAQRSKTMRAVRSKNTKPEKIVKKLVKELGFRFTSHRKSLPGKPDLIFSRLRKVVFVHGCFWHGHNCRRGDRIPQTNRKYWTRKIERNRSRDRRVNRELAKSGWKALIVWECQLKKPRAVTKRVSEFLSGKA